jgi:alpha-glucosidase
LAQIRDPFGLANWPLHKGRDGCRTPMPWQAEALGLGFSTAPPWLPLPADHRALAVDLQESAPTSTLHLTRRLLALRRGHAALRVGSFDTLHTDEALLLARREAGEDALLLAFNLGPVPREAVLPTGRPLFSLAGAQRRGDTVRLPPWSCLIATAP